VFSFPWFSLVIGEAVKLEGPTIVGLGGGPIVELFTTGAVPFPVEAVPLPVEAVLFTTGAVPFPACDGFVSTGWLVADGGGVDGVDGADGGDSDDGGWPVDGENGIFGLNCAKVVLTELSIVAIPITIIVDIKRMPNVFWLT
jgi:hypothetical protein